jgi:hypothetical protein
MKGNPIDLPRVLAARAELDRLAAQHPERCGRGGPQWADNLEELDRLTMGTPTKERVAKHRERLRASGYQAVTVNLPPGAHETLKRMAGEQGLTYGDLLARALAQYAGDTTDHNGG